MQWSLEYAVVDVEECEKFVSLVVLQFEYFMVPLSTLTVFLVSSSLSRYTSGEACEATSLFFVLGRGLFENVDVHPFQSDLEQLRKERVEPCGVTHVPSHWTPGRDREGRKITCRPTPENGSTGTFELRNI
jgi:hypothetical protein